jgi:hypothetical protein
LAILQAIVDGQIRAVRSSAHALENSRNPDARRAEAVTLWLDQLNPLEQTPQAVTHSATQVQSAAGLRALHALHLAWARHLAADFFVTTDDRILSKARILSDIFGVTVINPIAMLLEISP